MSSTLFFDQIFPEFWLKDSLNDYIDEAQHLDSETLECFSILFLSIILRSVHP